MAKEKFKFWQPVERHLYGELMALPRALREGKDGMDLILMVSGGADSLALLLAFRRLAHLVSLGLRLQVVHVHHGALKQSPSVIQFRNRSQQLVTDLCQKWQIPLKVFVNTGNGQLSETQARQFRLSVVRRLKVQYPQALFVWGHHADDLLETRLMRLLRGVGPSGLRAMRTYQAGQFRPWLGLRRQELECYLAEASLAFMRDPQQQDLRSWLRLEVLPKIEKKLPGSTSTLARSLELLAQSCTQGERDLLKKLMDNKAGGLVRSRYLSLETKEKFQVIALYLSFLRVKNYTQGQVEEIVKRLDNRQKIHTFKVAGLDWQINAQQIRALPAIK